MGLVCFKLGQLLGRSDQPLGGTFVHTNSGKTWEGPKPGRETSLGIEAPSATPRDAEGLLSEWWPLEACAPLPMR